MTDRAGAHAAPIRPSMELGKIAALLRRDFLVAWSYRTVFVSDIISLAGQAVLFAYVSRIIDPSALPTYGGAEVSYLGFVTIGIALTAFLQVGLGRMTSAIRSEQLMGTLEQLLMTPTRLTTLQIGWVAYDLVYIPLRTAAFLTAVALASTVSFEVGGILPAAALVIAFLPFVWGLGVASAAGVLTFRRGAGIFGFAAVGLTFTSGAYFPLDLFPSWIEALARLNPIAIAVDGIREALIGGASLGDVWPSVAALAPMSAASFLLGMWLFRLALKRELRAGTLGLY